MTRPIVARALVAARAAWRMAEACVERAADTWRQREQYLIDARHQTAARDGSYAAWLDAAARDCRSCPCCQQVPCGACLAGGVCDAFSCDFEDGSDRYDDEQEDITW